MSPGAPLGPDDLARYARHLSLLPVGADGQRRLRAARVLSVGAGGLGSPVLLYLAAAGVGTLGIIDDDVVDESNLQRQVIHGEPDIGRAKTDSAADAIGRLNSGVAVVRHTERLTAANALEIVSGYDLVVDGSDNFATRYLVNDACAIAGIPYVWGSILGFEGQLSVFWQDAPDGRGVTYRDLHPTAPPPGSVPSCAEAGVLGSLCGVLGSMMATEALKLIIGIGEPLLGRVLMLDVLSMRLREVEFRSRGGAPITEIVPEAGDPLADELPTVDVAELAGVVAGGARLIDVREPYEAEIVQIPGSQLVPLAQFLADPAAYADPAAEIVLYCKSGGRSAQALQAAREAGLQRVRHLEGGVIEWVERVQPDARRY
nr:molybdopterin-synthase adenylyltransferase MoeB [Epidermidibacterium keratini]